MRLEFDLNNNVEKPEIVLGKRNYDKLGSIINFDNLSYEYNLMSYNKITFTLYKELNNEKERLWDEIKERRLIWLKEFNEWFQIDVTVDDENGITKTITGTSLCEAELGQVLLKSTEINTENDIKREEYINPTVFYKPSNPNESLLHRLLKEVPNYSIKYVDESLWNIQRTFSIDGTSIYDELTGEIAEEIGCLFLFDSTDRSISVYDLKTNCNHCGHRAEYTDICPECGSTDLNYGYGNDTTIFVDSETLAENISLSGKQDEVKNYIKVCGGDDVIDAAIAACNPTGTQYIYAFSDRDREDMSESLVSKLNEYSNEYESLTPTYQAIMKEVYDAIDEQLKLESTMMPDIKTAETNAQKELAKLTPAKLSPIAVQDVSIASVYTVNNAVLGMAKCIVNSTVFKIEIIDNSATYSGQVWRGKFKITNRSDENDVAENTGHIEIVINDDYAYYVEQKIKKIIDRDDVYLVDMFDKKTALNTFKSELKKYCLSRLNSFESAYQSIIDVLIETNCANDSTYGDIYNDLYLPYYNKLTAIQEEIEVRASEIETVDAKLAELEKSRTEITNRLNLKNYLGDELWKELCSFRREDTYENSNYISDGLDNSKIITKAQELFNKAKKEAITASTLQMSLSTTMFNLLAIPEFKKITGMFEGGNWIRVGLDDKIYRLRLVHYKIDFSQIQNIEVEFSDVTQTANGLNDTKSLIDKVNSIATNFSYVAHQAEQGSKSFAELDKIRNDGLNTALYNISNSTNQDFIIDEHGITGRKWDDILGDYSPEQVKMNNNILVYTNDYWQTAKSALGKIEYYNPILKITVSQYGLIADAVISGILMGNDIVGGDIYSENYSFTSGTHIDLNTGDFTFAGGKLVYDSKKDTLNLTGTITFEGIDYSSPEAKKALQDSLGITDVQNDIDEFNNASILTPLEKKNMLDDWTSIQSEYQKNIELAKVFEVSDNSIVIAYTNAYSTLATQISKCGLDSLTTPTTIDTRIYNDINNYHAANVDFANLINKEAKKLSEQALIDAKAYSNEEISKLSTSVNKEISELNTELTNTQTYIDGAFKDGIVDDIELSKINQLIKQLEIEKLDVDNQYMSIYNNSFLKTDTKSNLKNTYDSYNDSHTSLINSINNAITILNSTVTQTEKQTAIGHVNNSFDAYKEKITKIYETLNSALDVISTLKVSDLRDSVNKDISDVNTLITDTKTYIDGVFHDKVIDESESASISQLLYRLDTEKADLDARYASIYNNLSISTASKNNLKSAKENYDNSHTSLKTLINTAVSVVQDTTKTDNQKQTAINNMNKGFTDYNSKLSALSTAFESAIDSISTNKLDNFINGDYSEFISDIQNQVDGKSETYYSPTQPYENHINVSNNAEYNKLVGDLWYDSDESVKKTYIYVKTANGNNYDYKWMEMEIPAEVFDMADGKAQIFTSKPSNYNKNDLWLIGNDYLPSTVSGAKIGYVLVSKNTNSGYTESDWVLSIKYTDDSALQTFINETYTKKINYLETQDDKKAETWYQASNPVGTSAWTENGKSNASHKGDIWYNTADQKTYIYDGSSWKLTTTTPPDEVFDKIDGKAQIFVSTPTTPYNVGDLWFNSNTSDIMTCITKRDSGNFVSSDWEKRNRYTDDSALINFMNGDYTETINNLNTQIDEKTETWRQDTDPSTLWTTTDEKALHKGDLWYNTSSQKSYIYSGIVWEEMKTNPPQEVFDKIDGKAQIFISTPIPPYNEGDLWFDNTSSDIMTCIKSRNTGNFSASDWGKRNKYTDNSELVNFVETIYTKEIASLQSQIDGQIETFYYDYEPSLQNIPASNWTNTEERTKHIGDLFFWKSKGYAYRFLQDNATWKWQLVQDTDITNAMAKAEQAQDTADGKRRVFVTTPEPPYDIGDLWTQGSNGGLMRCKVTRSTGKYNDSDWEKATNYTDDSTLIDFINGDYADTINILNTQIDGKTETWKQPTDPSIAWLTVEEKSIHKGDLWYNTSSQKSYIYSGNSWDEMKTTPPDSVFDKIDGKAQIFVSIPTIPYHIGDLWFNSSTSDILTCVTERLTGSFSESDWEKRNKYTDDSSLNTFLNGDYRNTLTEISNSIDKKADTYYQSSFPYSDYINISNNSTYNLRVGDLCYRTDLEKSYMYTRTANGNNYSYEWKEIDGVPSSVYDKIDSKASIYTVLPSSYNSGDLLIPTNNITSGSNTYKSGKVYKAIADNGNWIEIKYTDNESVQKWVNDTYSERVNTLETQMDGKVETYYQDSDPSSSWSTSEKLIHDGDLWYDTSKKRSYIYNGTSWEEIKSDVPDSVYNKIETKKQIFSSQPTIPYYKGDLWVQGSYGDILYCNITRETGTYNSSDWIIASKYTDNTVANNALNVATQAVSDSVLTPSEKRDLLNEINSIKASYSKYTVICSVMNIAYTGYTTAYNNLINNTTGSSSVYKLDTSVNTTLTSTQVTNFKNYFSDYYTAEANIIQSIQNATNTNVSNAQNAADKAQQDATEALGLLNDIAADNKITPVEKLQLKEKYSEIDSSYKRLLEKYPVEDYYGKITEFTNLKATHDVLIALFDEILEDMDTTYDFTSGIYTRDIFLSRIKDYYGSYQVFINYIDTQLEDSIQNVSTIAEEAKSLGSELKKCLGFSTEISSDYVISPYIGGGYLNMSGESGKVIIDPQKLSNDTYIYGVYNSNDELVMGVDVSGNGVFNGTITTNSGKIGGWNINSDRIYMSDTGISSHYAYYAFWAGETNESNGNMVSDAKFKVTHNGKLIATEAEISGTITTTSGTIGGFTIDGNSIFSSPNNNGYYGVDGSVMMCTGSESSKSIGGSPNISGWCFTAGDKFGVTKNGALYAKDVNITGNISAFTGNIGAFDIDVSNQSYRGFLKADLNTNGKIYRTFIQPGTEDSTWAFSTQISTDGGATFDYQAFITATGHIRGKELIIKNRTIIGGNTYKDGYVFNCDGAAWVYGSIYAQGGLSVDKSLSLNNGGFEIYHSTPYIDFHYGNYNGDHTARIIESSSGNLVAYNSISNASDIKLKKNIKDLSKNYIDVLGQLKPKEYRFKKGDEFLKLGFIAQDVESVLKKCEITDLPLVSKGADGIYSLDYNGIIAMLVLGYQEQEKQIKELRHLIENNN